MKNFTKEQKRIYRKFVWRLFCSLYSWVFAVGILTILFSVALQKVAPDIASNKSLATPFLLIGLLVNIFADYFIAKKLFYKLSRKILARWPEKFPITIEEQNQNSMRVKPYLQWLIVYYIAFVVIALPFPGLISAVLAGYLATRFAVSEMFKYSILQFR